MFSNESRSYLLSTFFFLRHILLIFVYNTARFSIEGNSGLFCYQNKAKKAGLFDI